MTKKQTQHNDWRELTYITQFLSKVVDFVLDEWFSK